MRKTDKKSSKHFPGGAWRVLGPINSFPIKSKHYHLAERHTKEQHTFSLWRLACSWHHQVNLASKDKKEDWHQSMKKKIGTWERDPVVVGVLPTSWSSRRPARTLCQSTAKAPSRRAAFAVPGRAAAQSERRMLTSTRGVGDDDEGVGLSLQEAAREGRRPEQAPVPLS